MFKSNIEQHGKADILSEVNDLKGSKYMGVNRTWDKSLLVRCSQYETKSARKLCSHRVRIYCPGF